jgi:hypothetical protein
VGSGECLDVLGKRKISFPTWDSNPVLSEPYPSHCIDEGDRSEEEDEEEVFP